MYIKARVFPNSEIEEVKEVSSDHFKVWTKQPAERNLANKRVRELLSEYFGVGYSVRLVSGHHNPSKIFDVEPLSPKV